MRISLSTQIEPRWTIERHAEVAAAIGYDALELVLSKPHAEADSIEADPKRVSSVLTEHGLDIACVTGLVELDGSDASEETVNQTVRVAALLGCSTVKIPSGRPSSLQASDEDFPRCAAALRKCCALAQEVGVVLTVETHLNMLTDTLAGTRRLLAEASGGEGAASPASLGVTYDICNVHTAGDDPVAGADLLREWIRLVHVKDGRRTPDGPEWCPIGMGEVDLKGTLRRLREVGYEGYVSVECLLSAGGYVWAPELKTAEDVARWDWERVRGMVG